MPQSMHPVPDWETLPFMSQLSDSLPRVAFRSLGCRVNFEEIECLRDRFVNEGYVTVPFDAQAEVYVINTCTVTGLADAESRKIIRRAVRRKGEDGLVIVTGCYAQRDPETLRDLGGVDLVLGNSEKALLFEHMRQHQQDRRLAGDIWVNEKPTTGPFLRHGGAGLGAHRPSNRSATSRLMRTRASLKIQDGCDERCTYCIIPSVRGPSVSRERGEIFSQAELLAGQGYREIALTGVNTGSYGRDLGEREGLAKLIRELHALGLPLRYRLNSLEPLTVSERLLDVLEDADSFCPHFHVPMQHGDSAVLHRMGRLYDTARYGAVIQGIHERFPTAGIGADVMAGFPGETDREFFNSRDFIASLPLSYLHVFSYSERSGTAAVRMPDKVSPQDRQERSRLLHELETELRRRFIERCRNHEETVLIEGKKGPRGRALGLTGNYLRVELDPDSARGEFMGRPSQLRYRENEFWRVRILKELSPDLASALPIRPVLPAPVAS